MPNQSHNQASNSTLAKLLEVDLELAATEAQLLSQLESVQEKRKSLKTVLGMFSQPDTRANTPVESPVQVLAAETGAELERVGSDLAPPLETSSAPATADSAPKAADTEFKGANKTLPSPTTKSKTTKFTQKATAAKSAGWQHYVRDEFTNNSLPEAVYAVLQRHADKVFEIPGIVSAIFVDDLPSDVGSKARRQVTNILSEGARKNKWYRGRLGFYSMSKAAAKTNVGWQL